MSIKSITPANRKSRTFLAFLALLFSICLCIASFQGGAFGAVQPLDVIASPWLTHLSMDEKGSEGFELNGLGLNQQVSVEDIRRARAEEFLREIDRMIASRLAVERAA
ncbi:MAG: hypothetical protein HY587_06260 [Candidatus Omnitrophica bacterium]|nr:hypothetical protein [Candidatus Omnitrophota bacterium]